MTALPLALVCALALAPALAGCGDQAPDDRGVMQEVPENQGMGGVNDGAPGGSDAPMAQESVAPVGNPAGAQNYPATEIH